MKRTLWAWSFYHPSVKILRSRCDSRLAGVELNRAQTVKRRRKGKRRKCVSEDFISLKHFMVSDPFSPQRKFKNSSMLRRER